MKRFTLLLAIGVSILLGAQIVQGQPGNDDFSSAFVIPHQAGWQSGLAVYTTVGATPDMYAASCWNTSPDYNVWFTFVATAPVVRLGVLRGGSYGSIRRINASIWESDGTTEVACNRYVHNNDDVYVQSLNLTVGDTYYISVDNNFFDYRGSFTLTMDTTVDYDFYEGAIEVLHQGGWQSGLAAYTTVGATPDRNAASCWNTSPDYNRWFKFVATSPQVSVGVLRGGSYGSIRRVNAAIWESDGYTEVACNRYIKNNDDVYVQSLNLTVGNTYYISVDNDYDNYRGSFTLSMDTTVDYDYFEGAIEIPHQAGWQSPLAAYTTVGATPDRNAASCWNTSPDYNRWFKFVATSPVVRLGVLRGGSYGTIRRINAAIWESDGYTEVACNRYVKNNDDVYVQSLNLTVGNTYYISVDNNILNYRGTFTLSMDTTVDYDFYEGAIEIPHQAGWQSGVKAYTTVGATSDRYAASCWNTSPDFNRWFKFVATAPEVRLGVLRGGGFGNIHQVNAAIWEADGYTEVACNRYVYNNDDVYVQSLDLTVGNTYYVSVDNKDPNYRGTFTLTMDTEVDYDFYEGAYEIPSIAGWCSANAQFTTAGATSDRNTGSCWNTLPDYNRWFKFRATPSGKANITVLRGGSYGNIRMINLALWESDGLTEVACNRYVNSLDNVSIQVTGLTPGNWYYISVDNKSPYYRGTFSLCIDDSSIKWQGDVSDDWADAGNWSGGMVPTLNNDVVILSDRSNYPLTNSGADASVKSLLIEPGAHLTIPAGKSLTVQDDLILESDDSGNASLIDDGTLVYDTTKSVYQTYLTEDDWHYVSAPVSNAHANVYLDTYLAYFTESDSTWHYVNSVNDALEVGRGYAAWAASWLTGAEKVEYHGSFNTGDITLSGLTYTPGTGAADGWNLIGNPFPSAVEWNSNWTKNNINPTIYVYDGASGQYFNWNANTSAGTMNTGEIPPAQGFWVKAGGNAPSLTIPQSERVHTTNNFFKKAPDKVEQLLLTVSGERYKDKMIVGFNKDALKSFDKDFDAYKIQGFDEAPQMWTSKGTTKLSMNILPQQKYVVVPVYLSVTKKSNLQLSIDGVESFDTEVEIYLEDKRDGKMINLRELPYYTFAAMPGDDNERFALHFAYTNMEDNDANEEVSIPVYAVDNVIYVAVPGSFEGDIEVYNLVGEQLIKRRAISGTLNKLRLEPVEGFRIVHINGLHENRTAKVYIK